MTDGDLIDMLIEDHRAVESLFIRIEGGGGTPQQRRQVADAIVSELSRHDALEERFLYPTVRAVLGDGVANLVMADHAASEKAVAELSTMDVNDNRFGYVSSRLILDIRQHMLREEGELFPTLRDHCDGALLAELGTRYREARRYS